MCFQNAAKSVKMIVIGFIKKQFKATTWFFVIWANINIYESTQQKKILKIALNITYESIDI